MSHSKQAQKYDLPLKPHKTFINEEDKHDGISHQGQKHGPSSFQHEFVKKNHRYERGVKKPQPSELQKIDGKEGIMDVQTVPQVQHFPCSTLKTIRQRRNGMNIDCCMQIVLPRGRKHLKGKVGQNTQDGTLGSWFKITVPDGMKYEKVWLMNSIQSLCSVPFTPVDFYYSNNRAQFFVEGVSASSALMDISYKICDEENQKIVILVSASCVPYSVRDKLEPKEMELLKMAMYKRYDPFQKVLDLQVLRFDPDLVGFHIDIILNRRNCMAATLQIIKEDFPEVFSLNLCKNKLYQLSGLSDITEVAPRVKMLNLSKNQLKSVCELDKMKALKLEELWLEGNPLCSTFPDQSTYISAIKKCFPKLLRLDGKELSPPTIMHIVRPYSIKSCKERCKISEALKSLVLKFLEIYFLIYDYGDRRCLLCAYHDKACFSLTIPFNIEDQASSSLCEYFKDNRNMKTLRDPYLRAKLLKHTKHDIVCSLYVLPKTQHVISSFMVEFWFQTENMLCFSVNGLFKEVEGKSHGSVRAFTRTFIALPPSSSGIFILNDELFVRNIIPQNTQNAVGIPVPTSTFSSLFALSQEQRGVVLNFSTQFGMKFLWSQKILQDSQWNYIRACQVFATLKANGQIPVEAFEQIP